MYLAISFKTGGWKCSSKPASRTPVKGDAEDDDDAISCGVVKRVVSVCAMMPMAEIASSWLELPLDWASVLISNRPMICVDELPQVERASSTPSSRGSRTRTSHLDNRDVW